MTAESSKLFDHRRRSRVRREALQVPHRVFERRSGAGRGQIVLEADVEIACDRQAAPAVHLEALPARDAVGNQDRVPSMVRTLMARQVSCSTSAMVSPDRTMSPTWTVRSRARADARNRLPSVSWRARPMAGVMMAEVASTAGRLAERVT